MLKNDVIRLVKTLSTTEKRYLKLFTKKQSGSRAYLTLFNLIDKTAFKDIGQIEDEFADAHPATSFETTCKYLLKIVTDSLVQLKSEKDASFQQMQSFMRARVFFERSLISDGFKELQKVQKLAADSQNHLLEYMAHREELNNLSALDFPGTREDTIIGMQMKGKNILKTISQIHEHHSLYELLKLRLVSSGKSISEHDKRNMNDLLLSELSLVTNKVAYNFESKKLHLLFQSFFFTSVGDYKSALKTFSELNDFFELNMEQLGSPPIDYLSSLEGILDSLRTIRAYSEMAFYIHKVSGLISNGHSEQFNQRAAKTAVTFQLNLFIGSGNYKEAKNFLLIQDELLLKETIISDYEKHCELLFYNSLTYFGLNEFERALRSINKIAFLGKANYHFTIYKAAKLLGILIRYELGDIDYLQYEIRAYKRLARSKSEILQIEKLIFKIVIMNPNGNSVVKNKLLLKKLAPALGAILHDKYELQVLKYFDFLGWIDHKFNSPRTRSKSQMPNSLSA